MACRAQAGSVAGEWRSVETNPEGFICTAELTLTTGPGYPTCTATGDRSIHGLVVWTLQKAGTNASAGYAASVELTGTEYVRGEMKGEGFFVLAGYRKDDPHNFIGLDHYRLAVADNGLVIGGITRDNGPWTEQPIAVRAQP